MAADTEVGRILKTKFLWELIQKQIESGPSGNRKQKYKISNAAVKKDVRTAAKSGKFGFRYGLGAGILEKAQTAFGEGLSPNDSTWIIDAGGSGKGVKIEEFRKYVSPETLEKFDSGNMTKRRFRQLGSNNRIKRLQAEAKKAAEVIDEGASETTLKGQQNRLNQSLDSFTKERAKSHQERFFEGDPKLKYQASAKWWDELPASEKSAWKELTGPIKEYNDDLYRKALASGKPAHLDDLLQLHHILPREFSGTNNPRQMMAALGRSLPQLKTEHASQHYHPNAKKFYEFVQSKGGTELYYPKVSVPPKMVGGKLVVPGASEFQPLFPAELNPGGSPWAGLSDAPEHKITLMNLLRKAKPALKFAGRVLPFVGAPLSAKAASDYSKAGQNKLAAAAAMSAVPGPLGWLGLAGEMGGLLWNKATEDPNFLRGPLDKRRHIPRRRGSL